MNYNDTNIYSEPLFPISQAGSLSVSSSSTQLTQTQEALATQIDERKLRKSFQASYGGSRKGDDEDDEREPDESDDSSQASGFDFNLDSLVIKASKMSQDYCTTGCSYMDGALNGGMPTFGITELYGEAGTGKTQLCLQLAITAQLPKASGGLDAGGVYYICTEDAMPTKRLVELVRHFQEKFPSQLPEDPMDNVFIEHVTEVEALMQCIDIKLASLARQSPDKKIRLVIIDSVAAIFRSEFEDLSQRTHDLRRLAQALHEYSYDHEAAIVVCNQVTASPACEGNIASLGMAWKNMITTRIRMSKSDTRRHFFVSFSPHVPSVGVPFQISASGVEVVPNQK